MFQPLVSALSLVLLAMTSVAYANPEPVKVPALFSKAYLPSGFDSNDVVQIVGEGLFRNTCYRHAETTVRVDEAQRRIQVGPVAYEYAGFCLQVILPFNRTIDVGILKPGTWEVVQGPNSEKLGQITIRSANRREADDFLYAPISQAFFQQKGDVSRIVLTGEFTNDCFAIERVKTSVQPDVLVIQPIARLRERANCKSGHFPFSKVVELEGVPQGRYLLHVRSMNGNAINTLVQVQ
jgi:hypothetical protein